MTIAVVGLLGFALGVFSTIAVALAAAEDS